MIAARARFARARGARLPWPPALVAIVLASAACSSNEPTDNPLTTPGGVGGAAGSTGAQGGGGAGGVDCYLNPKTHHEIINACTDAVRVKKAPSLKGLNADGSLPPPP